jgi:hypothetical protein
MADPADTLLCATLPVPAPGATTHLQRGPWQIMVERTRGGLEVLAHDGRSKHRWLVGMRGDGELEVCARAPRRSVHVQISDALSLAPGGRLRGYVAVPLPHEIVWHDAGGARETIAELVPRTLQTAWHGAEIGYAHEVTSRFFLDATASREEGAAMVPVVLHNASERPIAPATVWLGLHATDLRELRGRIVAAPRALLFFGSEQALERIKKFRGATTP